MRVEKIFICRFLDIMQPSISNQKRPQLCVER
jgi:hypothetical protein